jgi:membrane protease YdiL (CAAX protease family)
LAKPSLAKALGTLLLLFAAVYGTAFLVVGLLRLRPRPAVPVVILVSLAMALLLAWLLWGKSGGFAQFGFQESRGRYLLAAIVLGAPIGWAINLLIHHFSSGPTSLDLTFRPWAMVVYFIVGASIQEEVIFRGLLQSTVARQFPSKLSFFGVTLSGPAIIVALLFGVIHIAVDPITAVGAFVLGLLAGELRARSGSLVPAILVHALFNLFAAITAATGRVL